MSSDTHQKLLQLVKENRPLFWSVGEKKLDQLNQDAIVETILNYGNAESVRQLFKILGTNSVAQIFHQQINQKRHNYHPQTAHFFKLYFKRHASQADSHTKAN